MSEGVRPDTTSSGELATGVEGNADNGAPAGQQSDETEITTDAFFEVLSNRRRRYTLHCLEQEGGTVELGALARQVAAWENDKTVSAVSTGERKNVYTSLQQFHLPKLDEQEMVAFDRREGTVELGAATEEVDIYIEAIESGNVPWSQYYLGLAGVQALTVVIAYAGLVPGVAAGTFGVTALLASALAHTYYTRTEMRLGASETPPERTS